MTIQDQIYTIWFPAGIMLLFAVVGALRGVAREVLVSAAIVLGSLIVTLWASQWSPGIHDVYSGATQGQEEFTLAFSVLWLVVLVVGYGMGSFVPRGPQSSTSRLAGFLLGLANGAAVAGWSLRLAFSNLQNAEPSSPFYTNPVSFSLMVWSVWFPVALALCGALVVLVGPLRRAQTAVAQPSTRTDWEPYAAPPGFAQAPAGATGAARGIGVPPPSLGQPPPYTYSPSPTTVLPTQAAAPTTSLPTREASAPLPAQPYGTPARGNFFASQPGSDAPKPAGDAGAPAASQSSSWLVQPAGSTASWAPPGAYISSDAAAQASDAAQESGPSPADAPTLPVAHVQEPAAKCPHCGSPAAPGAMFCTECGTRLV